MLEFPIYGFRCSVLLYGRQIFKFFLFSCPFFFTALLSAPFSFSQPEFSFSALSSFSDDSSDISCGMYGDAFLNSPSLSNQFFYQFIKKDGYVSDEIKNEASLHLKAANRVGSDLNYGIYFSQKFGKKDSLPVRWQYFIRLADRMHLDAQFPKDLFDLVFFGNKKFAGDTVLLDNLIINYLRFQQFQAGFIKSNAKGNRFGIALSYLKGEENFSMKLNRGRLATDKNGEILDADFNLEIFRSDTSGNGLSAFNGWGLSTDLFGEFPFLVRGHHCLFRAEANDIGFIQWNEKSLIYKADTAVHFEGIYIDDILLLNDSVLNSISPDTISEDLQSAQVMMFYSGYLPPVMKLSWMMDQNKFSFTAGLTQRFNANFSPYTFFRTAYKLSSAFSAGTKISYGGYGKIGVGIEMGFSVKNFFLLMGSNNLEGFAFKKYSGGNSLFLALRKEF